MKRWFVIAAVMALVLVTLSSSVLAMDSTAAQNNRALAKSCLMEGKYDKAIVLYKEIMTAGKAIRSDSIYLASAYLREHKPELAKEVMFYIPSERDYADAWFGRQEYDKPELEDSLKVALHRCLYYLLDNIDEHPGNELRCVLSDYLDLDEKIHNKKGSEERVRGFIVMMSLLVLLIGVVFALIHISQHHKRKIEANMALAIQMQEDLSRLTLNHNEYNSKVKGLLSTKYRLLDQLSQIVYESTTTATAKRRVSETVTELIRELADENSPKNQELASFVDDAFNNLYSEFKTDFPDLRQREYNLFVYSVLGFSASTITVFLGEKSVTSVYERKRRLRNKIKESSSPRREEYLAYLGQRASPGLNKREPDYNL